MALNVESITLNQVTQELDAIFGELDDMIATYNESKVQANEGVEAPAADVVSTRNDILKSV